LVTPDTVTRAAGLGIDAKASLARNDGHGFFEALGDQVVTGPTQRQRSPGNPDRPPDRVKFAAE
jgi:glycerate-2-kinase